MRNMHRKNLNAELLLGIRLPWHKTIFSVLGVIDDEQKRICAPFSKIKIQSSI